VKRITTDKAAVLLGISMRTVQRLCVQGEIPSAITVGKRWTIDEATLLGWIAEKERRKCAASTCAATLGGDDGGSGRKNIEQAFRQLMRRRPALDTRRGRPNF
jgi:excisionase family DNA binding protein